MRTRLLALVLLSTTLLTGCLDAVPQDDGRPLRERAQEVVDAVRDAVEEAKARQEEQSGEVERRSPSDDAVLRTDTRTAFSYEEYSATVESVLGSLDDYWSQALPEAFGVRYSSPQRYVYYRPEESPGPPLAASGRRPRTPSTAPRGTSSPGTSRAC